MSRAVLTCNKLSIGYRHGEKTVHVVDNINASLCCGELVALIGQNGAGKSTLLRTLSAFQKPLCGTVCYSGQDIAALSANEIAKEVSVVLTANEPAPLTVREIVSLGRTPYTNFFGRMTTEDKDAVERAMDIMGIRSLENRKATTLSDGERQKCMIAKALAQETSLMLLDEPTAFLDFVSKVKLMRMLKQLAQENKKAILLSTHDIELAIKLADRIWLLSDNTFSEGSIDELADSGALQKFICDDGIRYNKTEKRIDII